MLHRSGVMKQYSRRFGLFRDPAVGREIAACDAVRDCQRIVHLLTVYEFAFDVQHALELALLYTFGSRSVARVLAKTGAFERRGQKRYDDTQLIINRFVEAGYDSPLGQRAISRMNEIHRRYDIANDDLLFVLWTFIDFPEAWLRAHGWRAMTAHEAMAWFTFWRNVGLRMAIADLPETKAAFDAFVARYEAREMRPSPEARRVADATLGVLRGQLPRPLGALATPVAMSLAPARLCEVFGYAPPPSGLARAVDAALRAYAAVSRRVPLTRYPALVDDADTVTYGRRTPPVEALGVDRRGPSSLASSRARG